MAAQLNHSLKRNDLTDRHQNATPYICFFFFFSCPKGGAGGSPLYSFVDLVTLFFEPSAGISTPAWSRAFFSSSPAGATGATALVFTVVCLTLVGAEPIKPKRARSIPRRVKTAAARPAATSGICLMAWAMSKVARSGCETLNCQRVGSRWGKGKEWEMVTYEGTRKP